MIKSNNPISLAFLGSSNAIEMQELLLEKPTNATAFKDMGCYRTDMILLSN